MYWTLAIGAAVWLAVLGLFVLALAPSPRAPGVSRPDHAPPLVRALKSQAATGNTWWSWRVTRATPAHRTLVVEVEARVVGDARAIAAQIVEPVRTHGYDEILIYVYPAGARRAAAARRVQWTPRGGFSELILGGG